MLLSSILGSDNAGDAVRNAAISAICVTGDSVQQHSGIGLDPEAV